MRGNKRKRSNQRQSKPDSKQNKQPRRCPSPQEGCSKWLYNSPATSKKNNLRSSTETSSQGSIVEYFQTRSNAHLHATPNTSQQDEQISTKSRKPKTNERTQESIEDKCLKMSLKEFRDNTNVVDLIKNDFLQQKYSEDILRKKMSSINIYVARVYEAYRKNPEYRRVAMFDNLRIISSSQELSDSDSLSSDASKVTVLCRKNDESEFAKPSSEKLVRSIERNNVKYNANRTRDESQIVKEKPCPMSKKRNGTKSSSIKVDRILSQKGECEFTNKNQSSQQSVEDMCLRMSLQEFHKNTNIVELIENHFLSQNNSEDTIKKLFGIMHVYVERVYNKYVKKPEYRQEAMFKNLKIISPSEFLSVEESLSSNTSRTNARKRKRREADEKSDSPIPPKLRRSPRKSREANDSPLNMETCSKSNVAKNIRPNLQDESFNNTVSKGKDNSKTPLEARHNSDCNRKMKRFFKENPGITRLTDEDNPPKSPVKEHSFLKEKNDKNSMLSGENSLEVSGNGSKRTNERNSSELNGRSDSPTSGIDYRSGQERKQSFSPQERQTENFSNPTSTYVETGNSELSNIQDNVEFNVIEKSQLCDDTSIGVSQEIMAEKVPNSIENIENRIQDQYDTNKILQSDEAKIYLKMSLEEFKEFTNIAEVVKDYFMQKYSKTISKKMMDMYIKKLYNKYISKPDYLHNPVFKNLRIISKSQIPEVEGPLMSISRKRKHTSLSEECSPENSQITMEHVEQQSPENSTTLNGGLCSDIADARERKDNLCIMTAQDTHTSEVTLEKSNISEQSVKVNENLEKQTTPADKKNMDKASDYGANIMTAGLSSELENRTAFTQSHYVKPVQEKANNDLSDENGPSGLISNVAEDIEEDIHSVLANDDQIEKANNDMSQCNIRDESGLPGLISSVAEDTGEGIDSVSENVDRIEKPNPHAEKQSSNYQTKNLFECTGKEYSEIIEKNCPNITISPQRINRNDELLSISQKTNNSQFQNIPITSTFEKSSSLSKQQTWIGSSRQNISVDSDTSSRNEHNRETTATGNTKFSNTTTPEKHLETSLSGAISENSSNVGIGSKRVKTMEENIDGVRIISKFKTAIEESEKTPNKQQRTTTATSPESPQTTLQRGPATTVITIKIRNDKLNIKKLAERLAALFSSRSLFTSSDLSCEKDSSSSETTRTSKDDEKGSQSNVSNRPPSLERVELNTSRDDPNITSEVSFHNTSPNAKLSHPKEQNTISQESSEVEQNDNIADTSAVNSSTCNHGNRESDDVVEKDNSYLVEKSIVDLQPLNEMISGKTGENNFAMDTSNHSDPGSFNVEQNISLSTNLTRAEAPQTSQSEESGLSDRNDNADNEHTEIEKSQDNILKEHNYNIEIPIKQEIEYSQYSDEVEYIPNPENVVTVIEDLEPNTENLLNEMYNASDQDDANKTLLNLHQQFENSELEYTSNKGRPSLLTSKLIISETEGDCPSKSDQMNLAPKGMPSSSYSSRENDADYDPIESPLEQNLVEERRILNNSERIREISTSTPITSLDAAANISTIDNINEAAVHSQLINGHLDEVKKIHTKSTSELHDSGSEADKTVNDTVIERENSKEVGILASEEDGACDRINSVNNAQQTDNGISEMTLKQEIKQEIDLSYGEDVECLDYLQRDIFILGDSGEYNLQRKEMTEIIESQNVYVLPRIPPRLNMCDSQSADPSNNAGAKIHAGNNNTTQENGNLSLVKANALVSQQMQTSQIVNRGPQNSEKINSSIDDIDPDIDSKNKSVTNELFYTSFGENLSITQLNEVKQYLLNTDEENVLTGGISMPKSQLSTPIMSSLGSDENISCSNEHTNLTPNLSTSNEEIPPSSEQVDGVAIQTAAKENSTKSQIAVEKQITQSASRESTSEPGQSFSQLAPESVSVTTKSTKQLTFESSAKNEGYLSEKLPHESSVDRDYLIEDTSPDPSPPTHSQLLNADLTYVCNIPIPSDEAENNRKSQELVRDNENTRMLQMSRVIENQENNDRMSNGLGYQMNFYTPIEPRNFAYLTYLDVNSVNLGKDVRKLFYKSNTTFMECSKEVSAKVIIKFTMGRLHTLKILGNTLQILLGLSNKEWGSVLRLVKTIEQFEFSSDDPEPKTQSIPYRILYYLFKTLPKFSQATLRYEKTFANDEAYCVQIEYSKPVKSLTEALNPLIQDKMEVLRKKWALTS